MSLKFILLIPVLEIILFVLFGDFLGFFPVISLILVTGILGIYLLKSDISSENIKKLTLDPKEWIFKKISGILLLIPGFATDLIALFLLFRSLRSLIWDFMPEKDKNFFYKNANKRNKDEIIEVDYKDLDEK